MSKLNRRKFISMSTGAGIATALWGPLLERALAVQAHNASRSIKDVEHIVILMQENRSFDHYFGTMKGVRGFGDRFPVPLKSGQRAFHQSDGKQIVPPYRAHGKTSNAALVTGTPHNFSDSQAAWNQGKYGFWPLFKTPFSMAYYTREELPFQYAMAESFTICDAYHCSIATGTDPNRIIFFSGSNFDPYKREAGINCTDENSEPVNLRCWIKGALPEPGYTYQGSSFNWPTIPDVLNKEGISWRIYQDPNDNWTGAMHGCLAFKSFREAKPGSSIYENGMRQWTLENLRNDVMNGSLPQVSWILPSQKNSEHPGAPSSPYRGADFTHDVLEAITSNPETWSKTVFFLTFDENDGFFDHLPSPAVPSYNSDNTLAGKSTVDLKGMYFDNENSQTNYIDKRDVVSGNIRPWGMGPRVPMYILSPWSKGGWVNSEVADHTSVAQFIEKRFGLIIPAISPWHRAVSSDLCSAFDFESPNDPVFPDLPDTSDHEIRDEASKRLPISRAPETPSSLYQERGTRFSRALPYRLHCHFRALKMDNKIKLIFENKGFSGAVYHVYDLNHLDEIPKRYTVESGKSLDDEWKATNEGKYELEVYGPNGYFQKILGNISENEPKTTISYDHRIGGLTVSMQNAGNKPMRLKISSNAYDYTEQGFFDIAPGKLMKKSWELQKSANWYDFSVQSEDGYLHRFAGRVETSRHGVSDPAMAAEI
ncbi:MAG: phospholipase C, phosphocholine-specific [Daejeonella sp.]|uniref:phosphocholine-specific phospholipase C n=1 Tax=Daejeonella sp. TaxID=2805397 RepID=UPI002732C3B8|nr:phospholipase C, phosphocholine-specific [Daejeonella sp.]MDP3468440.1 phospholipase C, phosphocholine-specific [Daejeonella sp.]